MLRELRVTSHFSWGLDGTGVSPIDFSDTLRLVVFYANSTSVQAFLHAARMPLYATLHITSIDSAAFADPVDRILTRLTLRSNVVALVDSVFDRCARLAKQGCAYGCLAITDILNDATEFKLIMDNPDQDAPTPRALETSLIIAHNKRIRWNPENAFIALQLALFQIQVLPRLESVPMLAVSLSLLDQVEYSHIWRSLSDCTPQTKDILLSGPGLIYVLCDSGCDDVFPSLKVVSLMDSVVVEDTVIMHAMRNRKGIRFVRQNLLETFPTHSLPLTSPGDATSPTSWSGTP